MRSIQDRLLSIAKGAGIAAAGAALAYLTTVDWSDFGPIAAAVLSSAINALYQLVRK